jgi:ribose transport system permease protein
MSEVHRGDPVLSGAERSVSRAGAEIPGAEARHVTDAHEHVASGRVLSTLLWMLRLGPGFILVVLLIAMATLSSFFLTGRNIQNLGVQSSIVAVLALGQLLVIVCRGVDVSVGSVVALSGVLGVTVAGTSWASGATVIVAMVGAGLAVGATNAFFIVKGRIPQPLIVTVATLGVARGIALLISGGNTSTGLPPAVNSLGSGFVWVIPAPVIVVVGLTFLFFVLTTRTRYGRWLYAVGGNPEGARRVGLPVNKIVASAYMLCGLTAGIAGVLTAGRTDTGSPDAGTLLELDAITAVVIGGASLFGGRGSVLNVVIGALILGTIRNGLDLLGVAPFWQTIAIGSAVLLALELDVVRGAIEERLRVRQSMEAA